MRLLCCYIYIFVDQKLGCRSGFTWKPGRGSRFNDSGSDKLVLTFKPLSLYPQSTHRVAMANFWRTFHHDEKSALAVMREGVHAHPLSLYLLARTNLQWAQAEGAETLPVFHLYTIVLRGYVIFSDILLVRISSFIYSKTDLTEQFLSAVSESEAPLPRPE